MIKHPIGQFYEYPTMHHIGKSRHIQTMIAYDFDWVFLEIPVRSCIVRMLLTCPIRCGTLCLFAVFKVSMHY